MKSLRNIRREWLLLLIIVVIALGVGARAPVFLTLRNGMDIANDSAILAILVMGQMMVLLTRGIDLSVASNLALTGMVCALIGKAFPGVDLAAFFAQLQEHPAHDQDHQRKPHQRRQAQPYFTRQPFNAVVDILVRNPGTIAGHKYRPPVG